MIPKISGKIRQMALNDLAQVLEWRNSERIRKYMFTDQLITMEDHRKWFEDLKHTNKFIYLIFEYNEEPAGVVNLTNIDYRNHKCNWGFYLGKENLPSGTGTLMGQLAKQYAFETLNMRKLCGEVLEFNEASINLHLKLGFRQEGRFVKHVFKHMNYVDVLCFGLFNEQFNRGSGDE